MIAPQRLAILLTIALLCVCPALAAQAQALMPEAPTSEVAQILQRQRVAFPPFRAVWKQEVILFGTTKASELTNILSRLKENLARLDAEIAQEKDPARRATNDANRKKLSASIGELEKMPNPSAQERTPDKRTEMVVSITWLSPERFIVMLQDTSGKPGTQRLIYRNNGPIYTETESTKTVIVDKFKGKFLENLPVGLPIFAIDQYFDGFLQDFELKKEQDDKGVRFTGTYQPDIRKLLEEENKQVTPELIEKIGRMGPANLKIIFDSDKQLNQLTYTHGPVNKMSKIYFNYIDSGGVRVPQNFDFESILERVESQGQRQHLSLKLALQTFHKLTDAELESVTAAYTFKPGYKVIDYTGSQPVQTTSDEILKTLSP